MESMPGADFRNFRNVNRILVVKLRAIGDVLLSTIVLPNLRSAYPHARIDFLTERPSREILEGNPSIDTVVVFNGREEHGLSLIRRIRSGRYDMVIDLFGNPRSAVVTRLSGARYRVGFRLGWRKHCYNVVVEPRGGEVHNADFNLDALRAIGIPVTARSISVPVTGASEGAAERFFAEHGLSGKLVVALNPGGGWYTKRWPPERYADLGTELQRRFGAEIVLAWGPGEEELVNDIRNRMGGRAHSIPRMGLKELASLLKRCSVMITNDSGPMHIGAAMGTPIVGIYGPTRPMLQGPVTENKEIVQNTSLSCLGCNLTKCPIGLPCMLELPVDPVLQAFTALAGRLGLIPVSQKS